MIRITLQQYLEKIYDPSGLRTSLTETTTSLITRTYFPTPSFSEITSSDPLGAEDIANPIERLVSIEAVGMPIATVKTLDAGIPEVFSAHTDHLGSTRLATDQAGAVVEKTDYDAFGKITTYTWVLK